MLFVPVVIESPAFVPPIVFPSLSELRPLSIPVKFEPSPANDVAVNAPLEELNVRLVPLFGARSPVAAVANNGKQVVSDDSSAIVTVVAFVIPVKFEPSPLN